MPLRLADHMPIVTSVLDRTGTSLAAEGRAARVQALGRLEVVAGQVLGSAEVGRAVDNALAGPLPRRWPAHSWSGTSFIGSSRRFSSALTWKRRSQLRSRVRRPSGSSWRRCRAPVSRAGNRCLAQLARLRPSRARDRERRDAAVGRGDRDELGIRAALVRSSATLRAEVAAGLRRRMESLDNAGERRCLGARGIAFAVDLGICTLFFLVGVAVAWLVSSIAGGLGPRWLAVVGRSSSLVIWLSSGRSRVRRPGCDSCTCE
jgi:hypothetical protein